MGSGRGTWDQGEGHGMRGTWDQGEGHGMRGTWDQGEGHGMRGTWDQGEGEVHGSGCSRERNRWETREVMHVIGKGLGCGRIRGVVT